jgi:hypothetical protein
VKESKRNKGGCRKRMEGRREEKIVNNITNRWNIRQNSVYTLMFR